RRYNLPALYFEINPADIDAALAHLKDDGVLTGRLFSQHRRSHECVRVAAGDEVNAINLRGNLGVAYLPCFGVWIVTQVRHADDQLTMFLPPQNIDNLAC